MLSLIILFVPQAIGVYNFVGIQQNTQKHVLELIGYNIGRKWANNQNKGDLRSRFEKFYKDWENDSLSKERYESLHKALDPAAILTEVSGTLNQALEDPEIAAAMLENYRLFEKGLVWGIMTALKNIIVMT